MKLNGNGIVEWQKSLGGSCDDLAQSIIQTIEGGYAVAGKTCSSDGDVTGNRTSTDYWLVKLNSNGIIQWQKTFGGSDEDYAESIVQTTDGGYALGGTSASNDGDVSGNNGTDDFWVVKTDNAGTMQWQKSMGGSNWDDAYSMVQSNDGGYVIAGSTYSNDGNVTANYGHFDAWVVKLASCSANFTLYPDTIQQHNWVAFNQATGVSPLTYNWNWGDGNNSTGATPSHIYSTPGYYNICLSITDAHGCSANYCDSSTYIYKTEQTMITVNCVLQLANAIDELPSDAIISLYPNPATDQLFLETSEMEIVEINIYNTIGSLVSQTKQPQSKSIDISQLANGAYIAEIKTPKFNIKRRWVRM